MVSFEVNARAVVLIYTPDFTTPRWVRDQLQTSGEVTVSRGFTFTADDLLDGPLGTDDDPEPAPPFRFRFAAHRDGYFQIPGRVFEIENDVLIDESVWLERKLFVAERNVGIFRRIAKVKADNGPIVIGGARDNAIPSASFYELLRTFPNTTELDHYASARVELILGEFFDSMRSARETYEAYLSRRRSVISERALPQAELIQAEIDKYVYLRDLITTWLQTATDYSEHDWQRMIIKIILLVLPKYVAVLENVKVADFYSKPGERRDRYIDLCLVDAAGTIDVIEIKKPFDNALVGRSLYRGNSIPTRELSGSIMQAEKYLFHLSKWGAPGERELTERYRTVLPGSMTLRVTNPKAMIIMGRDRGPDGSPALTSQQMFDLEVIKRKYANMMDILTYDDLLRRLNNIIASLTERREEPVASS